VLSNAGTKETTLCRIPPASGIQAQAFGASRHPARIFNGSDYKLVPKRMSRKTAAVEENFSALIKPAMASPVFVAPTGHTMPGFMTTTVDAIAVFMK
jgi:hypothetical protein